MIWENSPRLLQSIIIIWVNIWKAEFIYRFFVCPLDLHLWTLVFCFSHIQILSFSWKVSVWHGGVFVCRWRFFIYPRRVFAYCWLSSPFSYKDHFEWVLRGGFNNIYCIESFFFLIIKAKEQLFCFNLISWNYA